MRLWSCATPWRSNPSLRKDPLRSPHTSAGWTMRAAAVTLDLGERVWVRTRILLMSLIGGLLHVCLHSLFLVLWVQSNSQSLFYWNEHFHIRRVGTTEFGGYVRDLECPRHILLISKNKYFCVAHGIIAQHHLQLQPCLLMWKKRGGGLIVLHVLVDANGSGKNEVH